MTTAVQYAIAAGIAAIIVCAGAVAMDTRRAGYLLFEAPRRERLKALRTTALIAASVATAMFVAVQMF